MWITSNYVTCCWAKSNFWLIDVLNKNRKLSQLDFRDHWILAEELLLWWAEWLSATKRSRARKGPTFAEVENSVPLLWPQLRFVAKEFSLAGLGYIDALIDDLQLDKPFWACHIPNV